MHFLRHSLVSSFESLYHYQALAVKEHSKANGEMMTENIVDNPVQNYRIASHRGTAYVCDFYRKSKLEATDRKYYIFSLLLFVILPSLLIFKIQISNLNLKKKKGNCFMSTSQGRVYLKKGKHHIELLYSIAGDKFCEQNFLLMPFRKSYLLPHMSLLSQHTTSPRTGQVVHHYKARAKGNAMKVNILGKRL